LLTLSKENSRPSAPACFCSFEGNQRIVQTLRLPVGLALTPAARVPGNAINKFVMSNILRTLVRVSAVGARRSY